LLKRVKLAISMSSEHYARLASKPIYFFVCQGDKLDSREQGCLANCQDRFLDVREQVGKALEKRQEM
jgi:hypothetical protein